MTVRPLDRLASWLVRRLPVDRADWGEAMLAESAQLRGSTRARWLAGILTAIAWLKLRQDPWWLPGYAFRFGWMIVLRIFVLDANIAFAVAIPLMVMWVERPPTRYAVRGACVWAAAELATWAAGLGSGTWHVVYASEAAGLALYLLLAMWFIRVPTPKQPVPPRPTQCDP